MIAYRAGTAMAALVRESLAYGDEAQALLPEIYRTEADLVPDERVQTLTVRLHHLTNPLFDRAARVLAQHLNATETVYPGTEFLVRHRGCQTMRRQSFATWKKERGATTILS